MPPQKVMKHQLEAAKIGAELMEVTDQTIYDRLLGKLQAKPQIWAKMLELLDNGSLERTKEVKRDDYVATFGPWICLFQTNINI